MHRSVAMLDSKLGRDKQAVNCDKGCLSCILLDVQYSALVILYYAWGDLVPYSNSPPLLGKHQDMPERIEHV